MEATLKKLTDAGWSIELAFRNTWWTCVLIPTTHLNYTYAPIGSDPNPLTAINLAFKDAQTRKIHP